MRQHQAELDRLDVRVVVVTFEPRERARAYAADGDVPWPIACDEGRALYRAYGMDRAPWWRIFGLSSLIAYARLLLAGRSLARGDDADVYQLGGDVLVDPAGVVRLHHIGRGPADRPPVRALLDAVRPPGR